MMCRITWPLGSAAVGAVSGGVVELAMENGGFHEKIIGKSGGQFSRNGGLQEKELGTCWTCFWKWRF